MGLAQHTRLRLLSGLAFAAVFGLLLAVSDPAQAISLLFVVPIALVALSDGLRGGLAGAIVASALLVCWSAVDGIDLHVLGWASRLTSFFFIGGLVGRFEDIARSYERRRLDERYAGELHDRVVQSLVLARYQLRENSDASASVEAALAGAKDIISGRLGDVEPGDLRLTEASGPSGAPARGGGP